MNGHDETARMAALYGDGDVAQPVEPFNSEAEQAVLAGLILDNQRATDVQDWLREDDFYVPAHRAVYAAILVLLEKNQPADGVTVGEWFEAQGTEQARDHGNLAMHLASNAFTSANVVAYAEIVAERSRLRQLQEVGRQLVAAAGSPGNLSASDIAARSASDLARITPAKATGLRPYREVLQKLGNALHERHYNGHQIGQPTPWKEVNQAIGGLRDGEVIVLAARSNQGKSTLAFQQSRFTGLREGQRVALFSMEMNDVDVAARDVSSMGNIPLQWLMGQDCEDAEVYWSKSTEAIKKLRDAEIVIDDDPQLSAIQIVARAKRAHRQKRLTLVVVDHLHEMALPGKQGEVIERGQALRDLKALAKNLKLPVLVLAQLNRGAAEGRPPEIKDIRGSGGIEEVADLILFIHRPEVYNPGDRPGVVQLIVGKGRNVKTGTVVNLRNRYEYQRAEDWDGLVPERFEELEPPAPKGFGPTPARWRPRNKPNPGRGGSDD